MEITKELNKLCIEQFGMCEVCLTAKSIFERMEEPTEEELHQAMDDELIYDEDLWEIIKYYQRPCDANFYEAMDEFYNDLLDILQAYNDLTNIII